ncbi:SDR family NAD(P)-dependent oxidoreductase [Pseudomonas typographi]|uniref:SDR family NAD(P)-dependent oxidoreductase n=1 Tax=Pseudomonas typographi TaxID=2715964 RepID=UPI00168308F9|nr:SDR family NAD(P)-dependent oxidoreductase [Pseudomonas typographi]MBD1589871.1 SDR family oxidoreductase [Pseudomonas typographi]
MSNDAFTTTAGTVLIIGASRGLGHAMAAEFLQNGWSVVGTIRGTARTALHDLAAEHKGRVEIEPLDITQPDEIEALYQRLCARCFDVLFVNAGTANANQDETIAEVSTDEFVRILITNALSPMRVIERLQDLVPPSGLIGVMSSGQGSITNNEKGGHEVYRGSKAALNMYMRSYAARHAEDPRAWVLMAPGWIRTALGGPSAPFSLEETVPEIVRTLLSLQGKQGLRYVNREGKTIPW